MFSRHIGGWYWPLLDRPDRLARDAIERKQESLLRDLRDGFDTSAVHRDVEKVRRCRQVVVPEAVMHELVVPHTFSGLDVEAHQRLRKESIAGTMTSVIIRCRGVERHV